MTGEQHAVLFCLGALYFVIAAVIAFFYREEHHTEKDAASVAIAIGAFFPIVLVVYLMVGVFLGSRGVAILFRAGVSRLKTLMNERPLRIEREYQEILKKIEAGSL